MKDGQGWFELLDDGGQVVLSAPATIRSEITPTFDFGVAPEAGRAVRIRSVWSARYRPIFTYRLGEPVTWRAGDRVRVPLAALRHEGSK